MCPNKDHFSRSRTKLLAQPQSTSRHYIVLNTHTPYTWLGAARGDEAICAGWGRFGPQPLLDICHDRCRRASSRLIPTHPLPHVDHGTLVRQRSACLVVALSVHVSSPFPLHVSVGYSATRTCCGLWLRAGAILCFGPAHIDENLWGSAAYRT